MHDLYIILYACAENVNKLPCLGMSVLFKMTSSLITLLLQSGLLRNVQYSNVPYASICIYCMKKHFELIHQKHKTSFAADGTMNMVVITPVKYN